MIQDFLSSWELFHNSYLTAWLIGFVLSMIGVVVIARDQIFIGAAISQASTLGIAFALYIGAALGADSHSWWKSDGFLSTGAIVFSIVAALITARSGTGKESHEAITGWVFLACGSLAILIVSHSPHGMEEVLRIVSSTIIGATEFDVALFAILTVLTAAILFVVRKPLILFIMDPAMAAAVGLSVRLFATAMSCWLGLTIALSIRSSGMLYTFGSLVLPALIAKNICREIRPMFIVAPAVSLAMGLLSFVVANHYDFPPGQLAVASLSATLVLAWGWRAVQPA